MSFKKPVCENFGQDGNAFAIIGQVDKALRKAGLKEQSVEFKAKAFKAASYDALLVLCLEYVEADMGEKEDDEDAENDEFFGEDDEDESED